MVKWKRVLTIDTEESVNGSEDKEAFLVKSLPWRSEKFNDFMGTLDTVAKNAATRSLPWRSGHQVPDAHPTPIPAELVELLLAQRPDWTSKNWKQLFNSISQRASPNLHSGPTEAEKPVI